jgi:hypothetical protein
MPTAGVEGHVNAVHGLVRARTVIILERKTEPIQMSRTERPNVAGPSDMDLSGSFRRLTSQKYRTIRSQSA